MTRYEGVVFFHSETGTEGGHWAFQDAAHIHGEVQKCPWGNSYCPAVRGGKAWSGSEKPEHWSYDGLHILHSGDYVIIKYPFLHKDYGDIAWEGNVDLKQYPLFTEDAFGMWIHADQIGMDRETWARMFMENWPAILETNAN